MSRTLPVPTEERFTSRLRSPAVAARIGLLLAITFTTCFVTGLISHYAQNVDHPVPFPTSPAWGYRFTQGLHVISGYAAVPLLLVKLWTVFPKLFQAVPLGDLRRLVLHGLERASIAALVGAALFQLVSGIMNAAQWYPWSFSFRPSHYAMAWVAIGALLVHVAVKLPVIRDALLGDVEDTTHDRPSATREGALSRRGLLRTTWVATGVAVLATAGGSVAWLRQVSVLAVRTGDGPQGIPINRSAEAAGVTPEAVATGAYALELVNGATSRTLDRADLEAMTQHTEELPIACVEGWSATATWTGVRVSELMALVDAPDGSDVVVTSLQRFGAFSTTMMQGGFVEDDRTLLALGLNGEELSLDHGFPCRVIAPNRPGVLQTKWVTRLEVST
ncbi:molybdopterin-dependent oxidoreductase [Nocardioides sp. AX2bis]|uniref:molybdopterin-dependent oxidoreductase n=1 Tax=Nocardioides sp. AX2bis TaxID=2653157 RepID=UPI0012F0A600|nr:molybdopterin-dependent oxidoreductase [Nocardioides sp. AX2bis]VXB41961.1 Molybdopterin-binding protein [Nocardioides sp. AX2bis]